MKARQELYLVKETWRDAVDGLKLITSMSHSSLTLHLIRVPVNQRFLGYGNDIMRELTVLCDRHNLMFHLMPTSEYGTPVETLRRFYGKHGFRLNERGGMSRKPLYWEEFQCHARTKCSTQPKMNV